MTDDLDKWIADREIVIVHAVQTFLSIDTGSAVMVKNESMPYVWMLDGKTMEVYVQFVLSSSDVRMAKRTGFRVCWRDGIPSQKAEGYSRQIGNLLSLVAKQTY
jgi:hypothetical protein